MKIKITLVLQSASHYYYSHIDIIIYLQYEEKGGDSPSLETVHQHIDLISEAHRLSSVQHGHFLVIEM